MKPDLLPDWKNESAYNYLDPKSTIPRQWAWEFLRRNEFYQNICDEIGQEY